MTVAPIRPISAAEAALRVELTPQLGDLLTPAEVAPVLSPQGSAPNNVALRSSGHPATPAQAPAEATPAQAVKVAAQSAVAVQGGLAPLLADLAQAVRTIGMPTPIKAAAAQALAAQPQLSPEPTVRELKSAVARSGLFLEAHLADALEQVPEGRSARETLQAMAASAALRGDGKAALLAFRDTVKTWLATQGAPPAPAQSASAPPNAQAQTTPPATQGTPTPAAPQAPASSQPAVAGSPAVATPVVSPVARETPPAASPTPDRAPPASVAQSPALPYASAKPLPASPYPQENASRQPSAAPAPQNALQPPAGSPHEPFHISAKPPPAPPYPQGPTSGQPPAVSSLPPDAPPAVVAQKLMQETSSALARQELLQMASLPDASPVAAGSRNWMFEIPIATPQGPAVAQFEVSRDGSHGSAGVEAPPVWRARFSLDVEPLGPVHANVSLKPGHTNVTLWAERGETAELLRGEGDSLVRILRRSDMHIDLAVHAGSPTARRAETGQFVDQAS